MNETGFVDHCLELLSPLGSTSARRMFGGHGLYVDGLCMALIIRDVLYLKVDDAHRQAFEAAGCEPFTYAGKNDEVHVMSYYTAPETAMESPAEMTPWARRALAAALAARAKAPPKRKKALAAPPAPAKTRKPAGTPAAVSAKTTGKPVAARRRASDTPPAAKGKPTRTPAAAPATTAAGRRTAPAGRAPASTPASRPRTPKR